MPPTNGAWVDRTIIAERDKPLEPQGGLVALFGNLAPQGAILKRSAADARLFEHEGRAVVFSSLEDLAARIDDPKLDVEPDDILVLQNAGPHSPAAMPEAGYLPIPKKLAVKGVKDMVRMSDARMSGTAFGTIVLHVTPDAASGGPLGLVRNGDRIRLSVKQRRITLLVDDAELKRRAQAAPSRYGPTGARLCPALRAGNPRRRRRLRFRLPQAALRPGAARAARPYRFVNGRVGLIRDSPWRHGPVNIRKKRIPHKLARVGRLGKIAPAFRAHGVA